ncbi:MAG: hypothetical protein ABSE68_00615 [Minisyncoccia bacterium]
MLLLTRIFFTVFTINIFPVLMPPTWSVLAYFQVRHELNIFVLALIGTFAATAGRMVLAKLSDRIIRKNILKERVRANIDVIKNRLIEYKKITIWIFLFYAFSPLPSNQLFIAYGLTELPLKMIAVPFFIGRFLSYVFWIFTASKVTLKITASEYATGAFMGTYYVIMQILSLAVVWLFTRINWEKLFKEKKLGLLK